MGARFAALSAAALAASTLATQSGFDLAISGLFFDPAHALFPLRDNWWLAAAGHTGLRRATLALWLAIVACAAYLPPRWRHWQPAAREAATGIALAAFAVLGLREISSHSCPWDLAAFGGHGAGLSRARRVAAEPGPGPLPAGRPRVQRIRAVQPVLRAAARASANRPRRAGGGVAARRDSLGRAGRPRRAPCHARAVDGVDLPCRRPRRAPRGATAHFASLNSSSM